MSTPRPTPSNSRRLQQPLHSLLAQRPKNCMIMSANSPTPRGEVEETLQLRRSPRLAAGRTPNAVVPPAVVNNAAAAGAAPTGARRNLSGAGNPRPHSSAPPRASPPTPPGAPSTMRGHVNDQQMDRPPRQRVGSGPRFSIAEMESMLTSIEQVLPIGPDEWERVADNHGSEFPNANREAQSLRRKFQALYNVRIPTGDPQCPAHVRKAKRIKNLIEERADASNLSGIGADLGFPVPEGEEAANNMQDIQQPTAQQEEASPAGENAPTTQRILFGAGDTPRTEQQHVSSGVERTAPRFPRPLVSRTPSIVVSTPNNNIDTNNNSRGDQLHTLLVTNMLTRMEREDTDREERRAAAAQQQMAMQQQQQLTMAMVTGMMAVVSALNPSAAAAVRTAAATEAAVSTTGIGAAPPAAENNNRNTTTNTSEGGGHDQEA